MRSMFTLALVLLVQAPSPPVSTYSIVARDPETGQLGVAVQSHWFSVGSVVTWAEAGVGAVATQSFAREAYGPELLEDLRAGMAPKEALDKRVGADEGRDVRQVAAVDARGGVDAWTGKGCIPAAGHVVGEGFSVQANIMLDAGVVPAMAAGYRQAKGDFAERLLAALEAAQRAGGDARGMQSAALLIVDGRKREQAWRGVLVDLRVEDHARPLEELRRLLNVHRAYAAANAGDERLAAGDAEGALAEYTRADALYAEQVELSYWRAVGLVQQGADEGFELLRRVFARDPAWLGMAPRLAAAGQLPDDPELLARIAALAPAAGVRAMVARADPARIERDIRTLAGFGTRHSLSSTSDRKRGIGAARNWLQEELERISAEHHGGRLQVELAAHQVGKGARVPDGAEIVNVVATLPGSDPGRLVVLSGHYDSMCSNVMDSQCDAPGANDDASGTAVVLEAARLLGGLEPRATLVFMAVAGEEQGLLGSRAQAEQWKKEGKEVAAMFTMDIVGGATGSNGRLEPWRLRVFSEGVPAAGKVTGSDNDAPSRQLARYLRRAGETAVPGFAITLIFRQDRYLRGGDHKPFNELGWPAVRLTEPNENYAQQHQNVRVENGTQYGDLPEFVDFAFVSRVSAAVAAAAGELGLAPPAPATRMDTRRLSPHTRLSWEPCAGAAGYAVLLRRTHEPDWTQRRDVGEATEITLEGFSKDDWLFALEAYDAAGHRSLPVYPTPQN
ncbi:MAG: M20/M25/M40 family metallo-hydrolase [Planctomycetota bacterium]|nr:MAG: M20/M25/M40 family metallo-hydrolase [Planctomycetota bacterium]